MRAKQAEWLPRSSAAVGLTYAEGKGKATVAVDFPRGRALDFDAEVEAKVADALDAYQAGHLETTPWVASAHARMKDLSLGSLTPLQDRQVKGKVSGELSVTGLHRDAVAHADFKIDDLRVGETRYENAAITASLDKGKASARVRIDQQDGFLEVGGETPATWGERLVPDVNVKAPRATLRAKAFRAAVIQPFLDGAVDQLDGRIDADMSVALENGRPVTKGSLAMSDGVVQIPILGQELTKVKVRVNADPSGRIRLDEASAVSASGRLNITGWAATEGLALKEAQATLHVPHRHAIPVGVDGQDIGEAYGDIRVKAVTVPTGMDIKVDVNPWHTELPRTIGRTVQELDSHQEVRVGVVRDQGGQRALVKLPLDAEDVHPAEAPGPTNSVLDIGLTLGDDVVVTQGTTMKVFIAGKTHIRVAGVPNMTGQLRIPRGFIEVQGKKFEIEKGTITFNGDPANPVVVLTAGWDAPDGSRIFADYTGPVQTGKVTLRSEPARPQSEVLSLIVFGTPDGMSGQPTNGGRGTSGTAVNAAGGVATQGLNKAMSDLTGLDNAQFKLESDSRTTRPELEVQVAKDISVGVAYVIGVLPLNQPDKVFATASWRFRRNWELKSQFGDRGSTMLDAVWQKRY